VLNLFDDLNHEGITILLVTHEKDVGERAQRVVHFRDGQIVG
jgi:putative ABC transport system ATP-binding protein